MGVDLLGIQSQPNKLTQHKKREKNVIRIIIKSFFLVINLLRTC